MNFVEMLFPLKMADKIVVVTQQCSKAIKIIKWKVSEGNSISIGCVLFIYKLEQDKNSDSFKLKSTKAGTVHKILQQEGDVVNFGENLLELMPCIHPTVMKDMCAECGADLRKENSEITANVPMIHSVPELKVSLELAQKLGKADNDRLLKDRKLVLLVDLDQTLIHTTNDNIPPNIKDVHHFQLYGPNSPWYHTRLRPGTHRFLENMSNLYELHICTFGARNYAHMIAMFLDRDEKLFSHRILSRDECFNSNTKTANLKALFPCGDNMVCIIDDREDVWCYASNLIHVKPYHFFQHTGDINAPPGLDKHEDDDKQGVDLSKIKSNVTTQVNGTAEKSGKNVKILDEDEFWDGKKDSNNEESPKIEECSKTEESPKNEKSLNDDGGLVNEKGSKIEESLKNQESPMNEDPSPKGEDPSSKTEDPSPKGEDPSSKTGDLSSKTEDPSSKTGDPSSKTGDPSSKTGDPSSKTGDLSSKTEDPISKTEDPSSKTGDPTSKTEDLSSKTGDPTSKTGDPSSKTEDPSSKTATTSTATNFKTSNLEVAIQDSHNSNDEVQSSKSNQDCSENENILKSLKSEDTTPKIEEKSPESCKIQDIRQKINNTSPKVENSQKEDGNSKIEAVSPKNEELSPKIEESCLQKIVTSPKIEEMSSKIEDSSLQKNEDPSSKSKEDPSPKIDVPSSENQDPSPKNEDLNLKLCKDSTNEVTIPNEAPSPKIEDPSAKNEDPSPKNEDPSPKNEDPSPKNEDPSPKNEISSPTDEDPKVEDLKNEDSSPKTEELNLKPNSQIQIIPSTEKSLVDLVDGVKKDDLIEIDDPDDYLLYLEEILTIIHRAFYEKYDKMKSGEIPDLKEIVPKVRSNILKGLKLVFSGLVPTYEKLEQSKAYQVAKSLGAKVTQDLESDSTHLVAVRPGTAKVNLGRRKKTLKIVTPDWLWACAERWEHVDERLYPLNSKGSKNRHPPPHCSSPQHAPDFEKGNTRKRTASGRFMDTINPLMSFSSADIADMDREVEDIFNESESESENKKTQDTEVEPEVERFKPMDSDSSSSSDESLSNDHPHGWKPEEVKSRKRTRDDVDFDLNETNDESTADEFPSTKFRRGEALSSDLDIGQDSNSEGSIEAPDEIDDGEWNMMGAALEREFLSNN